MAASADRLLHPVRFRIVQALLGERELTTAQLGEALPDVATTTLYRHVALLVEVGILHVVNERRVRGSVERTYRLKVDAASIDGAEARTMSAEEHRQAFTTFMAAVLGDFDRYLGRETVDLEADLVGYRQAALHLTDDEMRQFLGEYRELLTRWLAVPAGPDRIRRLFTTVVMPAD
ncbi:helix-turn-helix domain-containing protein [Dactylosporangium sp. AC04546]|uniref:helix-turn-helix domain-containing protein n=1 Tax=Dactylosporangium sp. AC04546 TaxID=2862460 RepID=UPI001EDFB5D5|nr:helix-turn-helix domain-containing protein [Dactylosporangium sp. AC04546]WVK87358.1 helix-turn-helix domain-containing protein [Dactylosporangium sp. AC04546]